MIAQVAIAALTLSGGVSASETMTYGQFETSLLTQSAQRAEFGVEGPDSAFKFRFSDSVRFPVVPAIQTLERSPYRFYNSCCCVLYDYMLLRGYD